MNQYLQGFTSTDVLFEKYYGWSPYQYSANNPINMLDWNGKELKIVGSQEQVASLFSSLCYITGTTLLFEKEVNKDKLVTLTITGFVSEDGRFIKEQEKLKNLIEDGSKTTLLFKPLFMGGSYDPESQEAKVDIDVLSKPSSYFYYSFKNEEEEHWSDWILGTNATAISFDLWDIVAHELLGHGHDKITNSLTGDKDIDEQRARSSTNNIRRLRGKRTRVPVGHLQDPR